MEFKESSEIFTSYFYDKPNVRTASLNRTECFALCDEDNKYCSAAVIGTECEVYEKSPSQSYGVQTAAANGRKSYIPLCRSGIVYFVTSLKVTLVRTRVRPHSVVHI